MVSLNSGHCSYECTVPGSSGRKHREKEAGDVTTGSDKHKHDQRKTTAAATLNDAALLYSVSFCHARQRVANRIDPPFAFPSRRNDNDDDDNNLQSLSLSRSG